MLRLHTNMNIDIDILLIGTYNKHNGEQTPPTEQNNVQINIT